jgi:hypothetical protein
MLFRFVFGQEKRGWAVPSPWWQDGGVHHRARALLPEGPTRASLQDVKVRYTWLALCVRASWRVCVCDQLFFATFFHLLASLRLHSPAVLGVSCGTPTSIPQWCVLKW